MSIRSLGSGILGLLLCGFLVNVASGQEPTHALSISVCFPDLIKKTAFTHDPAKSYLSLLAVIDKDTFERAKLNTSLMGQFAKLPWDASYDEWNTQRTQFFQGMSISQNQYRDVIASVAEADPQAAPIIDNCFHHQMANRYGLFYLPAVVDKNSAYIQFFWRATDGKQDLEILDSSLKNAVVVGGDTYAGHLFPPKSSHSTPPITGDPVTVQLKRTDPNAAITASLSTDPQTEAAPLIVPPMSPPAN